MYDSIPVQLRSIPSVPFLNQQDLRGFVAPLNEYILERQTNLTIEEILAVYSPPADLPPEDRLNDSKPRPLNTRNNTVLSYVA